MQDTNGRTYARLSQLHVGQLVQVDSGFDCMPTKAVREVHHDEYGLFIYCNSECAAVPGQAHHGLEGQLASDNDFLIGIYPL